MFVFVRAYATVTAYSSRFLSLNKNVKPIEPVELYVHKHTSCVLHVLCSGPRAVGARCTRSTML